MTIVDIKAIIKNHRIEAGLTMKELADLVGVSEATVSRWESGNIASMKHPQIANLCKALHISPALIVPSIDYNSAPAPKEESPLSAHEKAMVDAYKKASDKDKYTVDMVLNEYSDEDLPALAEKEKGADLNDSTAV
ncbi:helix-turn-helix domain-containing protein [Anaerovibrio lipolyticus]|uniref:helix-turn-helix domain-containing protein n=1 Tax=Anaerovibrio lipolyticus TaxID=82374 RepID=UPI0026E94B02|nr:helix-turn-helix transcriptional regulator [Anaerovibrio lipolyticus]MBE6106756.1 helix-turn-helix transcriptional regulator [Anaerovibrio lipolyticus]